MFKTLKDKYFSLSVQVRASLWFIACTVLLKGISFITVPIFTRIMTTEQYGIYNVYLTWYEMTVVVATLSLDTCAYMNSLTKYEGKEKDVAQYSLLELAFFVTAIISVIVLILINQVSVLIKLPKELVVLMLIQVFFTPAVNFWLVKKRFQFKYISLVVVSISMAMFNSLLGIVFVLNANENNQATLRIVSIVLVQIVFGLGLFLALNKGTAFTLSTKYWKWGIALHIPILPHMLSLKILGSADRIMINNMIDSTAAALYSAVFSIAIVVNLVKTSIIDAIRPWIYQKLKENDTDNVQHVLNGVLLFVFLLTLAFVAFAPEVIYFVTPAKYHAAVYCVPPVMISSYFTFLYSIYSIIELYYEETKKIMIASVTAAVLNILLNYLFIPLFGYIAAAFTTLVCYIFLAILHYYMMRSVLKNKKNNMLLFDNRIVLLLSVVLIGMLFLFEVLYDHLLFRYLAVIILLCLIVFKRKYFIEFFTSIKSKKTS